MSIYHVLFLNKESNFPKCVKSEKNQQHILALIPPTFSPNPKYSNLSNFKWLPKWIPLHRFIATPFNLGDPYRCTYWAIGRSGAGAILPSTQAQGAATTSVDGTLSYSPKDQRGGKHASDSNTLDWKNLVLVKNPGVALHFMRILGPKKLCQPAARSFPTSDQTSSATP